MRAVLLVVVVLLAARPAWGKVYVCDVLHVYDVENGELLSAKHETSFMHTWPKIVFDDDTGIFKYGLKGQWTEERMRIMSKGSDGWSAAGYYMHNDTIFIAIRVLASDPPSFIWMDVFQVYTGTCKVYGN